MLSSFLATGTLKQERYTVAASDFPDPETMLFTTTVLAEKKPQFISLSLNALVADASVTNVERNNF